MYPFSVYPLLHKRKFTPHSTRFWIWSWLASYRPCVCFRGVLYVYSKSSYYHIIFCRSSIKMSSVTWTYEHMRCFIYYMPCKRSSRSVIIDFLVRSVMSCRNVRYKPPSSKWYLCLSSIWIWEILIRFSVQLIVVKLYRNTS